MRDDGWEDWQVLNKREDSSYAETSILFIRGSRQVFDVVYEVNQSRSGWDGILGCVVTYDSGAGNERANINSKVFVGNSGHTPFTFKNRRIHSSQPIKPLVPDKEDSPSATTESVCP